MEFHTPHTRRATSWVVWQTGPQRARMDEMAEVADNNTTGTTEVRSCAPYIATYMSYTLLYEMWCGAFANFQNRSTSLRCRNILIIRSPASRRRVLFLRGQQYSRLDEDEIRTGCLRSGTWSTRRARRHEGRTGTVPESWRRTRWSTRRVQQLRSTRRSWWRAWWTEVWLEGLRQAATKPRCVC